MSDSTRRMGWLVAGLWGAGLLAGLVLIGLLITRSARAQRELAGMPTRAWPISPPPSATATAPPTRSQTPSLTPTVTPTPTLKPTRTHTPTRTITRTAIFTAALPRWPAGPRLVIGTSVEGRPLEVYRFGAGAIRRMVIAGIHGGNEWNTVALADELIAHVQAHPDTVPPDVTLYILRNLNPDGYARALTVSGRVNANGVDLNRNWPSHWRAEWSRSGCWSYLPTTGGTGPGSEPETQALMEFLGSSQVDALINYHSAALGIFAGGQPPDPASLSLAEAVAAVAPGYPYPPIDTGCLFSGQLIDWASEHGIAALDIELTNHRDTDFDVNLRILQVLLAWRR